MKKLIKANFVICLVVLLGLLNIGCHSNKMDNIKNSEIKKLEGIDLQAYFTEDKSRVSEIIEDGKLELELSGSEEQVKEATKRINEKLHQVPTRAILIKETKSALLEQVYAIDDTKIEQAKEIINVHEKELNVAKNKKDLDAVIIKIADEIGKATEIAMSGTVIYKGTKAEKLV